MLTGTNLRPMDERTAELCRVLQIIVGSIVDDVASIVLTPLPSDDRRVVIQAEVAPKDRGKLIGRSGRNAEAIRAFVRAFATQRGGHYAFDVRGE